MKIGVFDSGYGGLTICQEIRRRLPRYDYIYLGDNARAPYGTHSFDVIYRYTLQAVRFLFSQGCNLVILACNTASAKALRTIQQKDLPEINHKLQITNHNSPKHNVLGVIRPTVEAVPSITKTGHVGILATPATVSSESYVLELEKTAQIKNQESLVVTQEACPMWVPLIEAGEHTHPGADYFVDLYLSEILAKDAKIDTLVLGCTHYPLLLPKINAWLDEKTGKCENEKMVNVLSQGSLVADSLADYLNRHPEYRDPLSLGGSCTYLTTENADRFAQSASLFLNTPVSATHVDL
ncbi:MAG: glutamate racemase [Paludibacteraceae bacterium]|nr:glutamate racemase [Paludibacteraceae bacterium]